MSQPLFMKRDQESPVSRLEALRASINARAAGWWRVSDDRQELEQIAFAAAEDMPEDVVEGFIEATRHLSLNAVDLGIVMAAMTCQVKVSHADELPPDRGSGLWLRRFEADQSVAVPVCDRAGILIGIVSLAVVPSADPDRSGKRVADLVLSTTSAWPEFAEAGLGDSPPRQSFVGAFFRAEISGGRAADDRD